MTTFAGTNGRIVTPRSTINGQTVEVYAVCDAPGCTWVGPWRKTAAAAKRDAVRHHTAP